MITHIIYHILGRKVGCTKNMDWRLTRYKEDEGSVPDIIIIEELHDKTDQQAGDIEWAWADKFGYKRGLHYTVSMKSASTFGKRRMAKITHEQRVEFGRRRSVNMTAEKLSVISSIAGKALADSLTPKQRSDRSRRAAEIKYKGSTQEQRSGWIRPAAIAGAKAVFELGLAGTQQQRICYNCGFKGSAATLGRWHLDRCRKKSL